VISGIADARMVSERDVEDALFRAEGTEIQHLTSRFCWAPTATPMSFPATDEAD
jgi:hypothetical protein